MLNVVNGSTKVCVILLDLVLSLPILPRQGGSEMFGKFIDCDFTCIYWLRCCEYDCFGTRRTFPHFRVVKSEDVLQNLAFVPTSCCFPQYLSANSITADQYYPS